jgi:hypothetical protein
MGWFKSERQKWTTPIHHAQLHSEDAGVEDGNRWLKRHSAA